MVIRVQTPGTRAAARNARQVAWRDGAAGLTRETECPIRFSERFTFRILCHPCFIYRWRDGAAGLTRESGRGRGAEEGREGGHVTRRVGT
jgi:hypothetical protein